MNLPTASEWLYSGKAFLAAVLAFYIALLISLPNPYWAFATVYLVSHPLSGATRSKAVYRAMGTVIGAGMALVLVPMFASSPVLMVLAIGLWSTLSLYLALLDNKPSTYTFLLASYTTPLVAVPAIMAPGTIFDIAVARSEEILLGIVCASVVSTVLFPSRVSPVIDDRVASLLDDAGAWVAQRLRATGRRERVPLRLRLLGDIVGLDGLITHLGFDASRRAQTDEARQIRFRMTMLVPQVASLTDAIHAIARDGDVRECSTLLRDVVDWLEQGADGTPAQGDALRARIAGWRETLGRPVLATLAVDNAAGRLRDVVDLWQDCLALRLAFSRRDHAATVLSYRAAIPDGRRHFDHVLMLYAAAIPASALVLAAWAWLYSGWPAGAGGVVMVAVGTGFFAASDTPSPMVGRFLLWEAISIAVALVYLFYILPQVTTFVGVAFVLAPPLLAVGLFTGRPAFNMGVLLLTSQSISDMVLRNSSAADFEVFANSSVGMLLGLIFAIAWTAIARPFGVEIAAQRLARANWREQKRLVVRGRPLDPRAALSATIDRSAQQLPRLALLEGESPMHLDALRDLRVCVALVELRSRPLDDAHVAAAVDHVMAVSASYFSACLDEDRALPPPADLLAAIGDSMASIVGDAPDVASTLLRYRLALLALPSTEPAPSVPSDQPLTVIPQ